MRYVKPAGRNLPGRLHTVGFGSVSSPRRIFFWGLDAFAGDGRNAWFSTLLAVPDWILEPHWGWFRLAGLISAWMLIYFTWRLAREAARLSGAVFLIILVSLHPMVVRYIGAVVPDLPYAALSMALFWQFSQEPKGSRLWILAAGCAIASLLRPYGCLLGVSIAVAIGFENGFWQGLWFSVAGLAPIAAWSLRNRLIAGTASGYLQHWRSQAPFLESPAAALGHSLLLARAFFAAGTLNLFGFPNMILSAVGCGVLAVVAFGIRDLVKEKKRPWALAAALYLILMLCLHETWRFVELRYILPLLPLIWIFLFAGLRWMIERHRIPMALAFIAIVGSGLWIDGLILRRGDMKHTTQLSQTMEWIREHTPASAHFQAINAAQVWLMTGRPAASPPWTVDSQETWMAVSLRDGSQYLLACPYYHVTAYADDSAEWILRHLDGWARASPSVREVYRNQAEGTAVFHLPAGGA